MLNPRAASARLAKPRGDVSSRKVIMISDDQLNAMSLKELREHFRDHEMLVSNAAMRMLLSRKKNVVAWVAIRDGFSIGSTTAQSLCRRIGVDPEEKPGNE
jgi:aminoglycoside/choline kinase family phosphotransferase